MTSAENICAILKLKGEIAKKTFDMNLFDELIAGGRARTFELTREEIAKRASERFPKFIEQLFDDALLRKERVRLGPVRDTLRQMVKGAAKESDTEEQRRAYFEEVKCRLEDELWAVALQWKEAMPTELMSATEMDAGRAELAKKTETMETLTKEKNAVMRALEIVASQHLILRKRMQDQAAIDDAKRQMEEVLLQAEKRSKK